MQANIAGVLSTLGSLTWHLSIPALMILVVHVWFSQHKRYMHVCDALSLQLAKELDCELQSGTMSHVVDGAVYQDPIMPKARAVAGDDRPDSLVWRHQTAKPW
mmetsp:Transcript_140222/g.390950  ORF Transcript_140222/g.390950 Transcript_140222/m.390950 type:complete len:103 (-) Transcript_140222:78-386(-)